MLLSLSLLNLNCRGEKEPEKQTAPEQEATLSQPKMDTSSTLSPKDSLALDKSTEVTAEEFEGTSGIVEKKKPGIKPVLLKNVRSGEHGYFDRVVFEFEGGAIPGYHVEYIDRPVYECGSGRVVDIAGDGWLEVRFIQAQAHTDRGEVTVSNRERHLKLPALKQLELTCDFEATLVWVLGVAAPNQYRVLELLQPSRLVVDVKH